MKSIFALACLLAILCVLTTGVDGRHNRFKDQRLQKSKGIKCTDRWCGCHEGYCWKNMTGLGLEPSDVVWSPYRFCYKDEHCLLGCQKKENEDTGVCFVMDENFPPETGTHILCSVDDDCYTYRKKLYDDDKVRRLKRSVDAETLDADLKSHLQLLGKKLGFE